MAGDSFQKFKSSLNRGVAAISIKTSSSLEKVKIKTHIESIKSELERLYVSVGETAFNLWESNALDFSSLQDQLVCIKEKKDEIVRLEEEYKNIDVRDSEILGTVAAAEEQSAEPPAPNSPEEIVCPDCGSVYSSSVKFCRKCGRKLFEE